MTLKRQKEKNLYKVFVQFGILVLLMYMGIRIFSDKVYTPDFEAYCPFGGIQAFGSYFLRGSLACTMTSTQIMMGLVLAAGIMIFGKLFCGYICPVGTLSEYIGKIGEKLNIRHTIRGIFDLLLRSLKYILLFLTFYFTLSSSELFCKKFDPYYALATGFNIDVVLWFAIPAILLVVAGSLFFRLFWCLYICPLGAISNIFKFFSLFLIIIAIYLILIKSGVELSYIWPLAIICIGGYILEITKKSNVPLTLIKITRNIDSCTNCKLCTRKCPQGIDVANYVKVNHIDCNLCGECLVSCPEKNTLQINKRNQKWLPVLVLFVLTVIGFTFGTLWELPTINERWGTAEEISQAATFSQSGLKNIKCFGSSMAFASKMKQVKGVYGVSTYVKTHSVKILYNPLELNDLKLQEILFTPVKEIIRPVPEKTDSLISMSVGIENFFDPFDGFYLRQLLSQNTSACGFYTEYNCPVTAHIFFPSDSVPESEKIISLIESKILKFLIDGQENYAKLNYKVVIKPDVHKNITLPEYEKLMYLPVIMRFNNYELYSESALNTFQIELGENSNLRADFDYLISHLANNPGIVSFETILHESKGEFARIIFVDSITTPDIIFEELNQDSLRFTYSTGETGARVNPFKFNTLGITSSAFKSENNR